MIYPIWPMIFAQFGTNFNFIDEMRTEFLGQFTSQCLKVIFVGLIDSPTGGSPFPKISGIFFSMLDKESLLGFASNGFIEKFTKKAPFCEDDPEIVTI